MSRRRFPVSRATLAAFSAIAGGAMLLSLAGGRITPVRQALQVSEALAADLGAAACLLGAALIVVALAFAVCTRGRRGLVASLAVGGLTACAALLVAQHAGAHTVMTKLALATSLLGLVIPASWFGLSLVREPDPQ